MYWCSVVHCTSQCTGAVKILKENPVWYCERCTNPLGQDISIVCEWFVNCLRHGFAGSVVTVDKTDVLVSELLKQKNPFFLQK